MTEEKGAYKAKGSGDDDKNALEWIVFGVSLMMVLCILGYLSYQTYTEKPATPDLVVQYFHDPSAHAPQRYRVVVLNQGGETAEEVQIELSLEKGGEQLEKAELSIAYAPKESKREGWVNFKESPAEADTLMARVVSYKRP
ncbi:hypothetical protein H9Q13_11375 [Pontibacter sp. JH31]|uniref:TIGR02588 family protein n=1 Tax=Pontibacter aquaedesilientis TaxID=2766980 RepID=A0ABR7XK54_9BACT|nr:hypothetical protein [Pontibacter aquaedesilientis]MBD1397766.1 hypothetical protein [Pontibacter aquaedesilientis]